MPVYFAGHFATVVPLAVIPYATGLLFAIICLRKWAAGALPLCSRSLHGRTVIMTGGISSLTVTLIERLAQHGAQIILLDPEPDSAHVQSIIDAVRTVTSNERIFADKGSLTSLPSLHSFVSSWSSSAQKKGALGETLGSQDVAALVFCPETNPQTGNTALEAPGARHYLFQKLSDALKKSPSSFEPRVLNVVDPFYVAAPEFPAAAKIDSLDTFLSSFKGRQLDGAQALISVMLFNEHQRRINIENEKPPSSSSTPTKQLVANNRIIINNASAGFTRSRISRLICPNWSSLRIVLLLILYPFVWLFAKSDSEAAHNLLAILFAPPVLSDEATPTAEHKQARWLSVIPGAFYRDGRVVRLANKTLVDEDLVEKVWQWEESHAKETAAITEVKQDVSSSSSSSSSSPSPSNE